MTQRRFSATCVVSLVVSAAAVLTAVVFVVGPASANTPRPTAWASQAVAPAATHRFDVGSSSEPAGRLACGPVLVSYDPTGAPASQGAPAGALTAVLEASVRRWADALGRPVVFSSDSAAASADGFLVTIGWSEDLGEGLAGSGASVTASNGIDENPSILSGNVRIAADAGAKLYANAGPGSWGETIEHELGHVAGLDHATAAGARMTTPAGSSWSYTAEELAALAWVGDNPVCGA